MAAEAPASPDCRDAIRSHDPLGTAVPTVGLQAYLKRLNTDGNILILPAHVLVWAVGRCLSAHPEFNRRIPYVKQLSKNGSSDAA
jgi:hypothetical protein